METINSAFLGIMTAILGWIARQLWSIRRDRAKLRLDMEKLEHEVRFKKVYEEVSDILIKLAPMPMKASKAFAAFVNDLENGNPPSKEDQWRDAANAYNEARNFLHDNRLLIPKPIFEQIDKFVKALKSIIDNYRSGKRNANRASNEATADDCTTIAERALRDLEPSYVAIHDAIQKYLGIPRE